MTSWPNWPRRNDKSRGRASIRLPFVHVFVIGIDPGLTATGYGVVRGHHGVTPIAAGVIRTSPSDPLPQRLRELYDNLMSVLSEHQPHAMAIEQVFTNRNRQTAIAVGRAGGIAILAAAHRNLSVYEYTPTAVKAAVTGDGRAGKHAIQTMVARRLRLRSLPQPVDAADALAVALCHLQTVQIVEAASR